MPWQVDLGTVREHEPVEVASGRQRVVRQDTPQFDIGHVLSGSEHERTDAPGRADADQETDKNDESKKIVWQFRTEDARVKLISLYPKL